MLAYPIATAALLIGTATAAASTANPQHKTDFMRAMDAGKKHKRRKLSQKDFHAELHGDTKSSATLRKKMINKSTVVKAPGSAGGDRKLQNQNQNSYTNNANSNYNQNQNSYANNANSNYKVQDGSDDYFATYGEWDNEMGFNVNQYSFSYHRCASVQQFDDELAAEEDSTSVFTTKRFAVFRFCPEATCEGFQDQDDDCGCEDQCNAIKEANGYDNGDDDGEDQCETACAAQCVVWQQQFRMYGNYQGGDRKLQNNNAYDQYGNYNPYSSMTFDAYYLDEDEEDEDMRGARGEGCQSNYGEYMIEMGDYLQMMMEWQEERFETYCEYCEECMEQLYEAWMQQCMEDGCTRQNDQNRDLKFEDWRDLKFEDWKGSEHQENFQPKRRELGNDDDNDISYDYSLFYYSCPEYDTCIAYQDTCGHGTVDDYSEYFECAEVESNNGQIAYVGLRCAEDGFDITLAVFADQYCNEYIGDGVNMANFLGEEMEEGALAEYFNSAYGSTLSQLQYVQEDNVCIPCRSVDNMWEGTVEENAANYVQAACLKLAEESGSTEPCNYDTIYRNYMIDAYSDDDDDNDDDDNDDVAINYENVEINPLCENFYKVSARCDKHYRSYSNKSKQTKYAEAIAQEDLSCDFIDSIVMGNYDENGIINLTNNGGNSQDGWMANSENRYAQSFGQSVSEVSPLQVFGLIASIAAVAILGVWSMTLHKSLSKKGPWRPRNGLQRPAASPAQDLNRQSSGIGMARSASNTSYYMS